MCDKLILLLVNVISMNPRLIKTKILIRKVKSKSNVVVRNSFDLISKCDPNPAGRSYTMIVQSPQRQKKFSSI